MSAGKQLRICGPFSQLNGYSVMVRGVLRCALLAGYEVEAVESDYKDSVTLCTDGRREREKVAPESLIPLPEEQEREVAAALATTVDPLAPTLLIQLPDNLSNWRQYANGPLIGWTMSESDNLCYPWKHGARCVDLLLAPSRYCLNTFRRVIPEVPSQLLPIPVDERLWMPDEYTEEITDPPAFLFFSLFATTERKNWRLLMQAFAEEFAGEQKEVGLIVKPGRHMEVEQMAGWCREAGAWVKCDAVERTDWTLGALYRAADVFVLPSTEGYGLPYCEAALCGKPSIALSLGGAADVVNEDNGWLVPSAMAPVIGHMPHVYPRHSHNFASFEIDDLRKTLRRAYDDERGGAAKGKRALQDAHLRMTCKALAGFLDEALQAGVEQATRHVYAIQPPPKPSWGVVAGNWGDIFASAGTVRSDMAARGIKEIGLIWYGSDPAIPKWLQIQPWVREVIAVCEPDKDEMTRNFALACQNRGIHSKCWLSGILDSIDRSDIDVNRDVAFTQLRLNQQPEPKYWTGAVLPDDAKQWAKQKAEVEIGGKPFYLLNPVSVASNKMKDHWPFWSEALSWLWEECEALDVNLVVVSEKPILQEWADHPRIVNLSGQSRSMMDVLALAELSLGMITTSNNLGIYAPIAGIPSVVVCARTCGPDTFYTRWMQTDPIRLIPFDDAMPQFVEAVMEMFGERERVSVNEIDSIREAVVA